MRKAVFLVIGSILFVFVGATWAFATPPMSAADDDFHIASILCSREDSQFCQRTAEGTVFVPKSIAEVPCYMLDPSRGADCFRWNPELVETKRFNPEASGRSSIYYTFMGLFVGEDIWRSILMMRLVNVVGATVLFAVALAIASRGRRRALALAIVAVLFPVGIFHVASTNPSAWAILGIATFWLLLSEAWSARARSPRIRISLFVIAGAAAVIATIGRPDSVVYLAVSTIAVVVLHWSWLSQNRRWLLPLIPILLAGLILGIQRLQSASSLVSANSPDVDELFFGWWPRFHLFEWPMLMSYAVGGATPKYLPYPVSYTMGLGWDSYVGFPIEFPSIVGILGITVLVTVVAIGLQSYTWRKLVAVGLIFGCIFVMSFGWVIGSGYAGWAQARYYVAPLLVTVAFASLGTSRTLPLRKAQATLIWLAASVGSVAALMTVVRRTTNGQALAPDVAWNVYEAYVQWWWPNIGVELPISPNLLVTIGAFATAGIVGLLVIASRTSPKHYVRDRSTWVSGDRDSS